MPTNLLCEFNIAEKKEDKLTNIKKGKVILVKSIANCNFSLFSINPGAIKLTTKGIKISAITTKNSKPKNKRLKTSLENLLDFILLFASSEV